MRLLLLLALLAAPSAFAQSSATYIEQAGVTLGQPAQDIALVGAVAGTNLDRSLLGSIVSSNVVTISVLGNANAALIEQLGASNQFALDVVGSNNVFELQQNGFNNVFISDVTGDGNRLVDSEQSGTNNTYRLLLDGVDGTDHSLRQSGSGNTASQVVGPGMTPVTIEQFGGATISVVRR